MEKKYAALLVDYCLDLKESERLFIRTTFLAEPLVREIYKYGVSKGVCVETDFIFRGRNKDLITHGSDTALSIASPFSELAFREFDAFLYIRAPCNLRGDADLPTDKLKLRQAASKATSQMYSRRTADGSMRRSLCQYPTLASAQEAGMSLEEYQDFVYSACHLDKTDPIAEWLKVRKFQQGIVDHLNKADHVHYKGPGTDLRFRVKDRIWINSDGRTNMPSGEVFTAPIEDSVEGVVHFTYPSIYMGHEVEGITLWVEKGLIVKWEAKRGQKILDKVMDIEGTRRFGEAAIGCNSNINKFTKNILFDEKIGGTVHLAVGQSYLQNGGKNNSPIHWDMIADMKNGGEIYTDGQKIYKNGEFLI